MLDGITSASHVVFVFVDIEGAMRGCIVRSGAERTASTLKGCTGGSRPDLVYYLQEGKSKASLRRRAARRQSRFSQS